jgi:hypothetical protein
MTPATSAAYVPAQIYRASRNFPCPEGNAANWQPALRRAKPSRARRRLGVSAAIRMAAMIRSNPEDQRRYPYVSFKTLSAQPALHAERKMM